MKIPAYSNHVNMCVKNEALLKKVRVWRSWQRNPGTPLPKLPLSAYSNHVNMCVKNEALLKKVRVWRSWQRNPGTPLPKLPLSAPPGPKILTQHLIHFCSSEYGNETACLNNHVNTCVKDEPFLNPLRGEISKLLVLLVYHCGNVNSNNVEGVNQLILTTVQCNRGALNSIVNCWDDFRSAFEANKSDTSLCR